MLRSAVAGSTALLILSCGLVSAFPPKGARLLDAGWVHAPGASRLVVHSDQPLSYRVASAPGLLVLDVWPLAGVQTRWDPVRIGPVLAWSQQTLYPGIVRFTVWVRGSVRYKVFRRAGPHKLSLFVLPAWRARVRLPPSVGYRTLRRATGAGEARVHVVTVDLNDPRLSVRVALGAGTVKDREPAAEATTRLGGVAAINGGFFAPRNGQPLGILVVDGRLVSAPIPRRSAFAVLRDGRPYIGPFRWRGWVETPRTRLPVSAVNRPPRVGGAAVYTPEYGPVTPPHPLAVVVRGGRVAATASGRVHVPPDGFVVAGLASSRHEVREALRLQAPASFRAELDPPGVVHALGGGPRLVQDGRVHVPYRWEGFRPSLYHRRAARSAVGLTHHGKLLLVVVEASRDDSAGMTLPELARTLVDLGAQEAVNLDGGGSSTLVVGGEVVNRQGSQRAVPSLLVVRYDPQD
jgi:uncharacterized protein YigE (DUF2233 family)